jgi:hypothetical protein
MKRSPREQLLYFLSILFAVAPFVAGLYRARSTGTDLRLLWMAFAAALGAAVVMAIIRARGAQSKSLLALSAAVLLVATVSAGLVGFLLGATAGPGVWMVAVVLGLFLAASCALYVRSRPLVRHE